VIVTDTKVKITNVIEHHRNEKYFRRLKTHRGITGAENDDCDKD
jgi:hypothetical protein